MTAKKDFEFTYDGETYSIPKFTSIPMGAIRKARKGKDEMDTTFTILETAVGEDSPALAALDKMDAVDFQKFLTEWTQGAPLGESSDS